MCPSRIKTLENRIHDLHERMELMDGFSAEELEEWKTGCIDYYFIDEELNTVDPSEIFRASNVARAIRLANEELSKLANKSEHPNDMNTIDIAF